MARLLIVDDEPAICWGLEQLGRSLGHEVARAGSAEQGLEIAEEFGPDAIVLDVRLPGIDGLSAMEQLRNRAGDVPIVIITAYGDLATAVETVRRGAFEYVVKPFDLAQMERVLERALQREAAPSAKNPLPPEGFLVGSSPAMQEVFKRIALVSPSSACVLLAGESGTGKELAARAIHQFGPRAAGPFVAVNIASLAPQLAESELFGHERGAFTGAEKARPGLLLQAHGGTLFLDEVADIPPNVQVKLLRALEHGEITPVGSTAAVRSDFRVISATHQNLLELVKRGEFRHDLYFRLCTFQIEMPPLRGRPDDIPDLVEHFLARLSRSRSSLPPRPTTAAMEEMRRRPWYGNVRELRNAVEHALIVARDGDISPEHLPPPAPPTTESTVQAGDVAEEICRLIQRWSEAELAAAGDEAEIHARLLQLVEPPLLRAAIEHSRGQVAAAARQLGMHRTTLKKKLDDLGLGDDR